MEEFEDSTELIGIPGALRVRLATDGFLFIRGMLDARAADQVHDDMLRSVAPLGWVVGDPTQREPSNEAMAEHLPGYYAGCAAMQSVESLHRLAFDERLATVLSQIFGMKALIHPRKIPRVMWPDRPDLTTGPHQEWPFFQGSTDLVVAWVALHDIPRSAGGLKVLKGSQRFGVRPLTSSESTQARFNINSEGLTWMSTDYQAGDVLIFHCFTMHSAFPNRSGRLRISVDFRYQPSIDAIGSPSLKPQFWPEVPDWPLLTKGWETNEWVVLPQGFGVFEPAPLHTVEDLMRIPIPTSQILSSIPLKAQF